MLGNGLFGGANPVDITGYYTALNLDDSINEWARYDIGEDNIPLNANNGSVTKVISFWHKNNNAVANAQNLQRVMGNEGTTTDYIYLDFDTQSGDDWDTTRTFHLRWFQSSSAPATGGDLDWDTGVSVTDSDWHHYCIHITLTQGGFVGDFRATLYVDGVSKGESTVTGPSVYGSFIQIDAEYIGFGRAIDNTVVYSDFCVGQFGVWEIAKTDFNINDFYFNGAVNLGTDGRQGTTQLLNTPLIYITFNHPFSDLELFEGTSSVSFADDNKCNT